MKLTPTHTKVQNKDINFFVLDVETWGLNPQPEYLAFGVLYGLNTEFIFYNKNELQKELQKKKYNHKKIFGHNMEYDISAIFGNIFQNVDRKAIFNGSNFISANYDNGIKFYNSMNIVPFALSKIGEQLGYKKFETPEKFKNKKYKGSEITKKDIIYCVRDCKVTYKALFKMFTLTGKVKMTIGSLTMNFFRTKFLEAPIKYTDDNKIFFKSYFGGRTEVFKLGKVNCKAIDLNSLYPYVMSYMSFPEPSMLRKKKNILVSTLLEYIEKYEGCANIKVFHKDSYFGFLPYKDEKTNKLLFPVGKFEGCYNFNELRFALKYDIIEILSVKEVYYSIRCGSPFKNFVEFLYNERLKAKTEFEKVCMKLLLNNLYGKFAQRIKHEKEYFEYPPFNKIGRLSQIGSWFNIQDFGKDREDIFLITLNKRLMYAYTAIPSYASYVTSQARIELLKGLLLNSQTFKVCYCDTDSIFYEGEISKEIKISQNLGDWKIEDKQVIEIKGLKNYTLEGNKRVIKGVPKKAKFIGFDKFGGEIFEFEKYAKTHSGLREIKGRKTGENFIERKVVSNKYDKRKVLLNGETKTIKL